MHSSEICVTIDLIVVRRTHRSEKLISIKETNFFLEVIGLLKQNHFQCLSMRLIILYHALPTKVELNESCFC